ncbi:MAG: hypothetical protein EOO13_04000 [Chitinophagaceae bacterium]|nr:MAG: hypothetical protein EOO13_04000 [Chitinophagaceae bacterium]
MKKGLYALILLLVVVSGLVFANRGVKKSTSPPPTPTARQATAEEKKAAQKSWEATPAGLAFKKWQASPAGQKVLAGAAKIDKQIADFSDMEATITSLSLPPGSRLGFGFMARINGEDYIVNFAAEPSQMKQLNSLKANDKIIVRSHHVSYAPKYAYPIISGDYVAKDSMIVFQRLPGKGC